jgi:hypothetical protein
MSRFTVGKNSVFHWAVILLAAVLLAACSATKAGQSATAKTRFFEVHHEGRIYMFYDKKTYMNFLAHGETPYRLTRIGAGPKGETLVFGLRGKDKKKRSGIPAVELYDGKRKPARDFYGEMVLEGRIYVLGSWKEMNKLRMTGEAAYRYTMIGAGPKGQTVVIVLNKHNKKKKPTALIRAYRQFHGMH